MVVIVMRQTSKINYSLHFSFYPKKTTKVYIDIHIHAHTPDRQGRQLQLIQIRPLGGEEK